jgi:hypothetical protein
MRRSRSPKWSVSWRYIRVQASSSCCCCSSSAKPSRTVSAVTGSAAGAAMAGASLGAPLAPATDVNRTLGSNAPGSTANDPRAVWNGEGSERECE